MNQCSHPEKGRMSNEKLKEIDPSKMDLVESVKRNYTVFGQDHYKQAEGKQEQTQAIKYKVLFPWVLFFYSYGHFIFDIDVKVWISKQDF